MSLIKETGVGIVNANSYASVSDSNKYLSGNILWNSKTLPEKEELLKQASIIIDNNFEFWGVKRDYDTFLEFPRDKFFDYFDRVEVIDKVPVDIVKATCYVALDLCSRDPVQDTENATPIRRIQITGMMEVELGGSGSIGNRREPINRQALKLLNRWGASKGAKYY